eukprot:scaffold672964_cov52-Prasinocladus_malaysianus.AAC.1
MIHMYSSEHFGYEEFNLLVGFRTTFAASNLHKKLAQTKLLALQRKLHVLQKLDVPFEIAMQSNGEKEVRKARETYWAGLPQADRDAHASVNRSHSPELMLALQSTDLPEFECAWAQTGSQLEP